MARTAEGYKLHRDPRTGIYFVRFTHGRRRNLTTGTRNPVRAAEEAKHIYAEVVSGRRRPRVGAGQGGGPLDANVAQWLADIESEYDEVTFKVWVIYGRHFVNFFGTLDRFTDEGVEDYQRGRLAKVLRTTLIKELTALRSFGAWCKKKGLIDQLPVIKNPPKKKLGKPD